MVRNNKWVVLRSFHQTSRSSEELVDRGLEGVFGCLLEGGLEGIYTLIITSKVSINQLH